MPAASIRAEAHIWWPQGSKRRQQAQTACPPHLRGAARPGQAACLAADCPRPLPLGLSSALASGPPLCASMTALHKLTLRTDARQMRVCPPFPWPAGDQGRPPCGAHHPGAPPHQQAAQPAAGPAGASVPGGRARACHGGGVLRHAGRCVAVQRGAEKGGEGLIECPAAQGAACTSAVCVCMCACNHAGGACMYMCICDKRVSG